MNTFRKTIKPFFIYWYFKWYGDLKCFRNSVPEFTFMNLCNQIKFCCKISQVTKYFVTVLRSQIPLKWILHNFRFSSPSTFLARYPIIANHLTGKFGTSNVTVMLRSIGKLDFFHATCKITQLDTVYWWQVNELWLVDEGISLPHVTVPGGWVAQLEQNFFFVCSLTTCLRNRGLFKRSREP